MMQNVQNKSQKWHILGGWSKQASIHTHEHNEVTLVWGLLRLTSTLPSSLSHGTDNCGGKECLVTIYKFPWHERFQKHDVNANDMRKESNCGVCTAVLQVSYELCVCAVLLW